MRTRAYLLFGLVLGCSSDTFVATDAGATDAGTDVVLDSSPDASPSLCGAHPSALLCDDFERSAVQGSWETVEVVGAANLDVVPGWSGRAAHATSGGNGAHALLAHKFAAQGSWTLGLDLEISAATTPATTVVRIESPTETVSLEADGATLGLRITTMSTQTKSLGAFKGIHRVELARSASELRARIDGALVQTVSIEPFAPSALLLRLGAIDGPQASADSELRFDRVIFSL